MVLLGQAMVHHQLANHVNQLVIALGGSPLNTPALGGNLFFLAVTEELLQLVRSQLPPRPGGVLSLWFGGRKLSVHQTLAEQRLESDGMFTYAQTDVLKAWNLLKQIDLNLGRLS